MKTKWLASREFSASPGRAGRVLVTANGKPKAIMIPTSEATFARDLEMLDRVALAQSVASIRADSRKPRWRRQRSSGLNQRRRCGLPPP
jgi:hypothetical protein